MNAPILTRRGFAKGLGGIVLAFSLDPSELLAQAAAPRAAGQPQHNRMLDAWIRINADGTVTVFTGKVELGQGILTALCADRGRGARSAAVARRRWSPAIRPARRTKGMTAGSQSIENSGTALRLACAEVRAILLELAAPEARRRRRQR